MNKDYILVIGGSNVDIISKSINTFIPSDSNPGITRISFGGVGRNIVENLARLETSIYFISAFGNDLYGKQMIKELENLDTNLIYPNLNKPSSTYCAILNESGDMVSAICDNDIINNIDPKFIDKYDLIIKNSKYIVLDTNLSIEAIDYIFDRYSYKNIICDAISTSKLTKLIKHLDKIYLLKVNEYEYEIIKDYSKPKYLVISKGSKPIELIFDNNKYYYDVIKKDKIVNATGAGDALLSGIIYGLYNNKSIDDSIKFGIKCSSLTLDSIDACSKELNKLIKEL